MFNQKGEIQSFFWGKRPVLPVEEKGNIKLMDWGNRDKTSPFPQTGWARVNSLKKGKWNYLKPEKVKIPVDRGFEKGVWFDFKAGTEGVILQKDQDRRVYMMTENASSEYLAKTKHPRMPLGEKGNYKTIKNF